MRKFVFLAAMLLSVPAFAQSVPERTGVNAALGVSPSTADFVKQAAISDMFEIESSKLAAAQADARSKSFASKMVADHTKTSTELKGLVRSGKVKAEIPAALDAAHQDKLNKLKAARGGEFDRLYDDNQIEAHKAAVDLFGRYAKGGENSELKAFAAKHLPHLEQHLKMAQELKK